MSPLLCRVGLHQAGQVALYVVIDCVHFVVVAGYVAHFVVGYAYIGVESGVLMHAVFAAVLVLMETSCASIDSMVCGREWTDVLFDLPVYAVVGVVVVVA